ncbi:hypothetical protein R3P38DRAFT_1882611, partial [Favolaschia claudopus]
FGRKSPSPHSPASIFKLHPSQNTSGTLWELFYPQLRGRIDALSSAIEAQERMLQDNRSSDAYRDLNFSVDPMARLPLELQSNIFLRCIPDSSPDNMKTKPDPNVPPMVFMAVSRMWRDIALATPRLWAALRMELLPRSENFVELCRRWMKRAGCYPLTLAFHGDLIVDRHVSDLLDEFSMQLHHLSFHVAPTAVGEDRDYGAPQVPLSLNVQFTCLESLTIHGEDKGSSDALEYVELIHAAPALLECDLRNMFFHSDDWPSMAHSSLQQLRLGCPWPWNAESCQAESSATILLHLTLSALRGLYVTEFDIKMQEFIAFLIRSSPPLDTLFISFPRYMSAQVISDCFQHIPTLTSLTLDGTYLPAITILAAYPNLLPNLHHLTIQPVFPNWHCDAMMDVLSARLLKSFRIRHAISTPDEDTIFALQAFARGHDELQLCIEYFPA